MAAAAGAVPNGEGRCECAGPTSAPPFAGPLLLASAAASAAVSTSKGFESFGGGSSAAEPLTSSSSRWRDLGTDGALRPGKSFKLDDLRRDATDISCLTSSARSDNRKVRVALSEAAV